MPKPVDVVTMLEMLFGRRPNVKEGGKQDLSAGAYLGVYRDNEEKVHGICIFDRALAVSLGAALSMVPPGTVEEAKKSPELPEIFMENLHEVFNICVRFFTRYSDVSMRLREVVQTGAGIPEEVAACVAQSKRCDFSVTLPAYGGGVMSLFLIGG
jgi:hypothetical protein